MPPDLGCYAEVATAMSLTIELPPEMEARFRAEARSQGVPLDTLVIKWLARYAPTELRKSLETKEAERLLDELVESLPEMPVFSDEALRRENIYNDGNER